MEAEVASLAMSMDKVVTHWKLMHDKGFHFGVVSEVPAASADLPRLSLNEARREHKWHPTGEAQNHSEEQSLELASLHS